MPDDILPSLDRRALIRRMAAGGAVVWAAPMMHSAASAASSTSCGVGTEAIDWDDYTPGTTITTVNIGTLVVTLSAVAAAGTTLFPSNRQVTAGPSGGTPGRYVRFEMVPNAQGRNQTITLAFSTPVTGLSFSLFDIDALANGWRDELRVLTPGFTFSIPAGSNVVQGGGANSNRFRNSVISDNVPNTAGRGNLVLGHPGPITSFVMNYANGDVTGGGNQYVGLGDITLNC